MTKIPVGATIARAYHFVLENFVAIISIMWLPWAIMMAGAWALLPRIMAFSTAMSVRDFTGVGQLLVILIPAYLVFFVLLCIQMVGITQQALGLRQGSPYYYFSLGRPLWLLIGSVLLLLLIMIGVWLACVIAGVLVGIVAALLGAAAGLGKAAAGWFVTAVLLLIYGVFIYFMVRLTFLLTPVVVAENRIALKRAWKLSRGNFWRIFAIILIILIPLIVLESVFVLSVLHGMPPVLPSPGATPDQLAAQQTALAAWNNAMIARVMGYWYITYPLGALFSVLFYGFSAGAQAFAYRSLVPNKNIVR